MMATAGHEGAMPTWGNNVLLPGPLVASPIVAPSGPTPGKGNRKQYDKERHEKKAAVKKNRLIVCLPGSAQNHPTHLLEKPKSFDPSKEFSLVSSSGTKVAHYCPGVIPAEIAQAAAQATMQLEMAVNPQWKPNTRSVGKAKQMSFGQWRRSARVEDVGPQTVHTRDNLAAVQQWKRGIEGLEVCLRKLLSLHVPHFYHFLRGLERHQNWSFAGFSVASVNFNYGPLLAHVDAHDHHDAYCAVIPLGSFTGGEFTFVFAGGEEVAVPVQQGDIIIMQGSKLSHAVKDYSGCRYSVVLHTCHCLVRDLLPLVQGRVIFP
jgi:hypothetical protein